jgi:hypothetical protein
MKESTIQSRAWKAAALRGWTIFRNNVGKGYLSRTKHGEGRWIEFGLMKGSSDLIGWRPRPSGEAQIVCIECKTERGKESKEQLLFRARVEKDGGLYILARGAEDINQVED